MKKIWISYSWETKTFNLIWVVEPMDFIDLSKGFKFLVYFNQKGQGSRECFHVQKWFPDFECAERCLIDFVEENFRINNEAWND